MGSQTRSCHSVYPHAYGEHTNYIFMFSKNFFYVKNSTTFFT
ncbi:protein of unknown function [Xenorhabdus poinarii G6]|uniref:Uncharacterized protein n=1 Tax=Xenorhabdus poinarii G6 TaxID=1354304 RepID=A0A068R2S3_9GAMM|nr:protein of unknown function [Xenorhabdus poinarii G6]